MTNVVKGAAGPALGTASNWVGGALPLTTDIAEWQATPTLSLGPSLTGNLNVGGAGGGILVSGASANITHSGGTVTIGTGGFTQSVGNNKRFLTTGTISVNGNQTWSLANTAGISGLYFTGFTGTGNISVVNSNPASTGWGDAYFVKTGGTSTYSGTISLKDKTGVAFDSGTGRFSVNTTISVDGDWCLISGTADNVIYTYNNAGIVINGDYCAFGNGTGRTILMTCPLTLNGNRKVYSYHNASVSGTFTATSGFELLGPAGFHLWCPANIGGTVKLTSGWIVLGSNGDSSVAPNQFNNVSIVDIAAGAYVQFMGGTNSATITSQLIGNGSIYVNSTGGITFNNLNSTFTGFIESAAGSGFVNPKIIFTNASTANNIGLTVWSSVTAATSVSPWIVFQSGGTISNSIRLLSQTALTGSQNAYIIETNGNNSTLTQDITQRTDSSPAAAKIQVQLAGTGNNTVLQGRIIPTNLIGTVGITKTGTGKWTLENSSTCNGLTSLNEGTLVLKHDDAIGSSAGAVTLTSGTLQLSGGRNINKSTQPLTLGGASILVDADTGGNSITCGGVALNASVPVTVGTGSIFTLSNSGAAFGSGTGIIKNGDGDLVIGSSANTFTGDFTVNGGNVTLQTIANTGLAASWGAGSSIVKIPGELKVIGAGGSTNRTIMFQGSTPSLDASGTGTVTYSELSQFDNGERTITLKGSNTGDNTISGEIKSSGMHRTTGMITARGRHGSVLLTSGSNSGKILAIGGAPGGSGNALSSCELFDPTTNTWTAANSMSSARWICEDNIVTLNTGEVFIAGSQSTSTNTSALSTTEIYNPDTGIWRAGATMLSSSLGPTRSGASLTLLGDGKVLLVGGYSSTSAPHTNCQIFTPPVAGSGTGSWTSVTSALPTARYLHTSTLLSNNKVLVVGGYTGSTSSSDCRIFTHNSASPALGTWSASSINLGTARRGHAAILISGGTKVLVVGGYNDATATYLSSCEIFNIASSSWSSAAPMRVVRYQPTLTLLSDGKVLVTGGARANGIATNMSEVYDPATDTWSLLPGTVFSDAGGIFWYNDALKAAVWLHKANTLSDGRILFSGGYDSNTTVTNICTVYNPPHTVNLVKSGPGKWITSSTVSHSGTTTISGGTLNLGGAARTLTGGISISGGTLENGTSTITADVTASGGTIKAPIAGAGKSFDVVSGEVTLYPAAECSYTGGTTVDSSAVLTVKVDSNPSTAGTGKALGGGSVLVDGELRTAAGGDQKGKLRYGGSLSFGAGAKLHIGSAA